MRKVNAITLAGLMTGLHLILVIFFTYFPYSIFFELFTYIIAPLISALYTLKSSNRYTLIFALSTLLAGLLFNPIATVTYILPILIIGISFGQIIKLGFDELKIFYSMTMIYVFVFVLTVYTLRVLYGVRLDEILVTLLNLNETNNYLVYVLLLTYGVIQSLVIINILKPEIKKFGYEIKPFNSIIFFDVIIFLILLLVAIFYPASHNLSFLVSIIAVFSGLPIILFGYKHNQNRTKLLVIGFSFSFLFIFLPLLGILPTSKYPLAFGGLFTKLLMLGLKRFAQLHYVKKR